MAMTSLARGLQKVNVSEERKKRARENYRFEVEDFSRRQKDSFRLDLFQMYDHYLERLEAEQVQADKELEAMRPELEAEQEKVREARRKKRALELLKERRKEDYDRAIRKYEKKELEEINARAFRASLFTEQAESQKREMEDQDRIEEASQDLKARQEEEMKEYYRQMGLPVDEGVESRDRSYEDD